MAPVAPPSDEKCPVDPQTRQKWLEAARAKDQQHPPAHPPPKAPAPAPAAPRPPTARQLRNAENDPKLLAELTPQILRMPQEQRILLLHQWQHLQAQDALASSRFSLDTFRWTPQTPSQPPLQPPPLSNDREVSSIPRAPTNHPLNHAEAAAILPPANAEADTGHDTASGNWIYPSQSMFFAAMRRKGHTPTEADMQTIVPMHNAVNERAWGHILAWERRQSGHTGQQEKVAWRGGPLNADGSPCGGPRLVSFSGDSKALTPRAWWKGLWGYARPFDRHDWVVERCGGRKVDYVIDFYEGRAGRAGDAAIPVSFYLDVRPKLNSWEGINTRVARFMGW